MSKRIVTQNGISWINITTTTKNDVAYLEQTYPQLHPVALNDLLRDTKRPKFDDYGNHLFLVLHFPVWDMRRRVSRSCEVEIFLGENFVVTAHNGTLKPLMRLFQDCLDGKPEACWVCFEHEAVGLLYAIIERLVSHLSPMLSKVEENISRLEEDIFNDDSRQLILEVAYLRRDIIALQRIVRPQSQILKQLEDIESRLLPGDSDIHFGTPRDQLDKASDMISDYKELINGLIETAHTIATHRTNQIVQVLTVISVILMPLTLLSGIYGMNIALPLQEHPLAFLFVTGLMVAIVAFMLRYFKQERFL
jgi:magnesium transporter